MGRANSRPNLVGGKAMILEEETKKRSDYYSWEIGAYSKKKEKRKKKKEKTYNKVLYLQQSLL